MLKKKWKKKQLKKIKWKSQKKCFQNPKWNLLEKKIRKILTYMQGYADFNVHVIVCDVWEVF